jgi:peroxiredoxin Q/BCP
MSKLKEGDVAPPFEANDQNGRTVSLAGLKGKKVILYFYPKDDTPGCTAEACNLRDNHQDLIDQGFEVIGVSPDSIKSHEKFMNKYNLPFSLLADENRQILEAYGAWGEKKMYGKSYMGVLRTTFVISEEGKIEKVFEKVNTSDHTRQIIDELA